MSPDPGADPVDLAAGLATTNGLEVRVLTEVTELQRANAIWAEVWGSRGAEVPADLLRALAFTGSYVAGAYVDERMVAATLGFLAPAGGGEAGLHLHSHLTGVLGEARGRSVGLALKAHQRGWCLARGVEVVTWTYDPLQRANAVFNIERLGALPTAYHPDFYGVLTDELNVGDRSDRLLVTWRLRSARAVAALTGAAPAPTPEGVEVLVGTTADGAPAPRGARSVPAAPYVSIDVPVDANSLRRNRPDVLAAWRAEVRAAIVGALAAGFEFDGLVGRSAYLLRRPAPRPSPPRPSPPPRPAS